MNILVTGGAGFIGSAFVRYVLRHSLDARVVTLDKLTYAGNLDNLAPVNGDARHRFVQADICNPAAVSEVFSEGAFDAVVHFAAESHVDRSILAPNQAIDTNVLGTATVLEAARAARIERFLHVSTDEVYGDIDEPFVADESFPLRPSSPYAASKAGADLLALSYVRTYRLPVVVTRASNNYGPYQFPEKLIPLMISNAFDGQSLPVYGDGLQVRNWLYVDDHCRALLALLTRGREGEVYNVAGGCHFTNIEVVRRIIEVTGASETLISRVADRPGHDRRYALRGDKIQKETGFTPEVRFEEGLAHTVDWYRRNSVWTQRVKSGAYREYYQRNYAWRNAPIGVSSS
jgi:dTDP-glucose 4,6-dehydratase